MITIEIADKILDQEFKRFEIKHQIIKNSGEDVMYGDLKRNITKRFKELHKEAL